MEHVRWISQPRLTNPVLLCAFAGWNDAGEAATMAARHLAESWGARSFATIDAEEFFDFSVVRPQVHLSGGVTRELLWPHAEVLAAPIPGARRDAVFVIGIEPHLRWQTYTRQVTSLAEHLGVTLVVSMGALLADVPHTRDVTVVATGVDPSLIKRYDLSHSRYEGPTGIVGVIQHACGERGLQAVSLWAGVPGYTQQQASPKAALALVERVGRLLGITVPATDLREATVAYEREISELVAEDDELADYVQRLEHFNDDAHDPESADYDPDDRGPDGDSDVREPAGNTTDTDLPMVGELNGDELMAEVERYLRDHDHGD